VAPSPVLTATPQPGTILYSVEAGSHLLISCPDSVSPAKRASDAGVQIRDGKGFGDVVVGAGLDKDARIEEFDALIFARSGDRREDARPGNGHAIRPS